uniref:RING-type domain-containing protein n=1 Tax=Globisporangium ultimum (strain ATCC 200006 / CBS 805.95 / DAOM BR144) TaxID=431595 RepID=K3WSM7_GLOUD
MAPVTPADEDDGARTAAAEADQQPQQEPLLKYERVGGHFHAIFKDDSLSCIALHVNFICAGTYNGNVLLLELDGRFIRRLHQHYKKVNQVCIDETGQYIASCSDDGTVAVYTLFPPKTSSNGSGTPSTQVSVSSTGGEVNIYNYFSAVYAVQLEDRYAMKRERSFACGGIAGQLILNKKGWIIDKESTIHEGEGPVHAIRWKDGLIAWANDWGVKVYDAEKDQRVTYIERPPNCPPMELCRCHLEWQTNSVLIVGWAHTLRVIAFKKASPSSPTSASASSAELLPGAVTAEVIALISFDFFVAGISPWGTTAVCVLAYRPPGSTAAPPPGGKSPSREQGEGDSAEMPFPEIHVVNLDGNQVAADILNLKGYQRLRASDYKMPTLQYTSSNHMLMTTHDDASIYDAGYGRLSYICTPKDVVICRLRDVDDRVQWALSRKQYEQALSVALRDPKSLRTHTMDELIEYYIGELMKNKQFKKAAEEIKRLFVGDEFAKLWEKYVYVFAQRGQLSAIAKFIPTANPRLPRVQYEMVLKLFLDSDPGQLLEIIRKWPKPKPHEVVGGRSRDAVSSAPEYTETAFVFEPLYDAQAWINQLEAVVRRRRIAESDADKISIETSYVMEALAELYTATEQYDHALRIYLSQGAFCTNKDHAFKLITEHQLWPLVQHKVVNLMQIDRPSAVRMLVNQTEQLKIMDIVKQLEDDREVLHEYLHELFVYRLSEYNTEVYASLHETQVALYTEFAPSYLLRFLQTSNFVPLEKAYKYCSERTPPLWDAMIYILGRMGHHKKALDLILTQMRDINQAIQFVQENDENLWEYLIDLSLTSKENVEELLRFASQHKIDPIKLIRKIPEDMEIDDLKQKLIDIIANYRIQQNLCTGCNKVFENDRVTLLQRQVKSHKKARRVASKTMCLICNDVLRAPTSGKASVHVCVFECGHCYHLPCLEENMRMWKRADVVEGGDLSALRKSLGCFVCDHSTRAHARTGLGHQIEALAINPFSRGLTEDQLQRAKDTLLNMSS